jgi:diguanylate cyclase (GGDEF)-like protein
MSFCMSLVAQGNKLGAVMLSGHSALTDEHKQILAAMSDRIALAIHNLQLRNSLLQQAIRDPLTGLYNRRYLDETLTRELERANRSGQSLSIIIADVDHFKEINDTFGHDGGDEILRVVGKLLGSSFRTQDLVCRYGGEEFVIVLPETQLADALHRAEALRQQIKLTHVNLAGATLESLSISMGVAAFPSHGDSPKALIRNADNAMYRAKTGGRDRVEAASALS